MPTPLDIRFLKRHDGTHDVAILVQNVKLRRNQGGASWTIVDFQSTLTEQAICDGDPYHIKAVVKLYCKAAGNRAGVLRRRLAIDALRHRKPSFALSV